MNMIRTIDILPETIQPREKVAVASTIAPNKYGLRLPPNVDKFNKPDAVPITLSGNHSDSMDTVIPIPILPVTPTRISMTIIGKILFPGKKEIIEHPMPNVKKLKNITCPFLSTNLSARIAPKGIPRIPNPEKTERIKPAWTGETPKFPIRYVGAHVIIAL
jgi:hypothetical protein